MEVISKSKDITGQRFGRAQVLAYAGKSKCGQALWLCKCDCGNEKVINGRSLIRGKTRSCGCLKREVASIVCSQRNKTHGMSTHGGTRPASPEYNTWLCMKGRCFYPKDKDFHNYGAIGVTVCDRWSGSFEAFLEDVGKKPSPVHTLDRIDGTGNYEPGNVKWSTPQEQGANRKTNKLLTFNGKTQHIAAWGRELGISGNTIARRISSGWSVEKSLTPLAQTDPTASWNTRFLTFDGETLSTPEWEKRLGIRAKVIHKRLKRGWSVERALTEPVRSNGYYPYAAPF